MYTEGNNVLKAKFQVSVSESPINLLLSSTNIANR